MSKSFQSKAKSFDFDLFSYESLITFLKLIIKIEIIGGRGRSIDIQTDDQKRLYI